MYIHLMAGQPARAVQDLKDELRSLHLAHGSETSLMAQLDAAERALSAGRTDGAIMALENFIRHVEAQTPRAIDEAAAADLREFAGDLIALLETP